MDVISTTLAGKMSTELPKWLKITNQVIKSREEETEKHLYGAAVAHDLRQQLEHNEINTTVMPLTGTILEYTKYWKNLGCDNILKDLGNTLHSNNKIIIKINLKAQEKGELASVEFAKFELEPQETIYNLVQNITIPHHEPWSTFKVEPKAKLDEIQFGEIEGFCTKSWTASRMTGDYSSKDYIEVQGLFTLRMRPDGFFVSRGSDEKPQQILGAPKTVQKDQLEKALDHYISNRAKDFGLI